MSNQFILTAVLAVILSSSIVSAEYKWNGSDWIWTDDSKDDGGSVQDSGGGGRSGQNSRKFDGAGRNVNNIEGSGDVNDDYSDEDDAGSGMGGGGGGGRRNKNRDRDRDYDGVERKYDSGKVAPDRDEYDDDVYSESDDGEDIYVEGNGVENDNNNNNGVGGGYYTSTAPPNLNGGPRDRQQPPPRQRSPSASFFAQPGTLAAVVGGAVVGLLCAILCVMFVVYRMRKKDEGSYALDEPKRSPAVNSYSKAPSREFYA